MTRWLFYYSIDALDSSGNGLLFYYLALPDIIPDFSDPMEELASDPDRNILFTDLFSKLP